MDHRLGFYTIVIQLAFPTEASGEDYAKEVQEPDVSSTDLPPLRLNQKYIEEEGSAFAVAQLQLIHFW